MKQGNWEVANELFQQELELDPFSYLARYGLAEVSFQKKDLEKALRYLNEAARIRPEFFDPFPSFWIALPKEELNPLRLRISESYQDGSFGSMFLAGGSRRFTRRAVMCRTPRSEVQKQHS